ncbi:MAG: hypothetical protein LC658_14475, partial [Bacteroidales bacterium]|nr:hypothetical protein [Bacteroidales bacterium]
YQILQNNPPISIFRRGEAELKWIFQFPWISEHNDFDSEKYPFSSHSTSFIYQTVMVFIKNRLAGFFVFSVREGHLKTLYFCLPNGIEKEVGNYLKQYSVEHKIEVITVYKYDVALQFLSRKFPFLHAKKYGQKIYSSFDIKNKPNYQFQDGDGDVFFT